MDSRNRKNRGNFVWRIFGLLFTLTAIYGVWMTMRSHIDAFDWGAGRTPATVVDVNASIASLPAFFAGLETFAKKNQFQYSKSRISPDNEVYAVMLSRRDAALTGANVHETSRFELAFFFDPEHGGSQAATEELEQNFDRAMEGIAGLKVSKAK